MSITTYDLSVYYTDLNGVRQLRDFFGISRVAVERYTQYYQGMYPGLGTTSSKVRTYVMTVNDPLTSR